MLSLVKQHISCPSLTHAHAPLHRQPSCREKTPLKLTSKLFPCSKHKIREKQEVTCSYLNLFWLLFHDSTSAWKLCAKGPRKFLFSGHSTWASLNKFYEMRFHNYGDYLPSATGSRFCSENSYKIYICRQDLNLLSHPPYQRWIAARFAYFWPSKF